RRGRLCHRSRRRPGRRRRPLSPRPRRARRRGRWPRRRIPGRPGGQHHRLARPAASRPHDRAAARDPALGRLLARSGGRRSRDPRAQRAGGRLERGARGEGERRVRPVAAAVVVVVLLAFGWAAVVVAVALASAHDQATTADAIAVLGAAQYNGRPSPVFRARLDHAAALYQRGLAPVVLVTGGVGTGDTVSESEVGRRYLTKAGLPENAVIALAAGASTASSIASVARWFAGRDSRRVLLVSDGFHMLRLKIIATRLGLVPFTSPAPGSPIRANPR